MPRFAPILNARLASGEFQIVERRRACPAVSSPPPKQSKPNRKLSAACAKGKNHVEPVLSRPQAIAVADQHPHLNRAQKSVVEDVLSSPRPHSGHPGLRRRR